MNEKPKPQSVQAAKLSWISFHYIWLDSSIVSQPTSSYVKKKGKTKVIAVYCQITAPSQSLLQYNSFLTTFVHISQSCLNNDCEYQRKRKIPDFPTVNISVIVNFLLISGEVYKSFSFKHVIAVKNYIQQLAWKRIFLSQAICVNTRSTR